MEPIRCGNCGKFFTDVTKAGICFDCRERKNTENLTEEDLDEINNEFSRNSTVYENQKWRTK